MKKFMGRTMAKMNENRRNGRKALKGFTLVEIIVVLVILAILAAAMIPALTGYIDKAKQRTIVSEARNAVTAAQTMASEAYGLGRTVQHNGLAQTETPDKGYSYTDMIALADLTGKGTIEELTIEKGKVTGMVYKSGDNFYVKYTRDGGFDDVVDTSVTGNTKPSLTTNTNPNPNPNP